MCPMTNRVNKVGLKISILTKIIVIFNIIEQPYTPAYFPNQLSKYFRTQTTCIVI